MVKRVPILSHKDILDQILQSVLDGEGLENIQENLEKRIEETFNQFDRIGNSELEQLFDYHQQNVRRRLHSIGIPPSGIGPSYFYPNQLFETYKSFILNIPIIEVNKFIVNQSDITISKPTLYKIVKKNDQRNLFYIYSAPIIDIIKLFMQNYEEKSNNEDYVTITELAQVRGIPKETVYSWIKSGAVKAEIKIKKWRQRPLIRIKEFERVAYMRKLTELSKILGVSHQALYVAHTDGRIKCEFFRKQLVVTREELERIMNEYWNGKLFKRGRDNILRESLLKQAYEMDFSHIDFSTYPANTFKNPELTKKLVLGAKKGIDSAKEKILELFKKEILWSGKSGSHKYHIPLEQAMHYARIGILEAIERYHSFGVYFKGYVWVYMGHTIHRNVLEEYPKTGNISYDDNKLYQKIELSHK